MPTDLGRRIAPPRFLLFCLLFPAASVGFAQWLGAGKGALAGFALAAAAFLAAAASLLRRGEAHQMRAEASRNDANRAVLLAITGATTLVVLVAVAKELQGKPDAATAALVVGALMLAWLFSNTVYALHYADLYYQQDSAGDARKDAGGIDFPACDEPDYWDFLYFSFTLGMTFQTSDIDITARRIRRIALGHCIAAFVFNLGIVAFTINVLGG